MRLHILILFAICLVCPTLRIFPQVTDSIKGYTNQCQSLEEQEFIIGADVTLLQHIEDNGGVFRVNRLEKDGLQILKDHWFEYIRLTLWHTTEDEYKSPENVLEMTKRIQTMGLKLLLNIFYSDTWANPGQQIKPEAWQNLPFEVLKDSVYQYSRYVITACPYVAYDFIHSTRAVILVNQVNHNLPYRGFKKPLTLGNKLTRTGYHGTNLLGRKGHDPPLDF